MALRARVHLVVSSTCLFLSDVSSNITAAHCNNLLFLFVTTTNYDYQLFMETEFDRPFSGKQQLRAAEWRLTLILLTWRIG
jgi:hypothetical protein